MQDHTDRTLPKRQAPRKCSPGIRTTSTHPPSTLALFLDWGMILLLQALLPLYDALWHCYGVRGGHGALRALRGCQLQSGKGADWENMARKQADRDWQCCVALKRLNIETAFSSLPFIINLDPHLCAGPSLLPRNLRHNGQCWGW